MHYTSFLVSIIVVDLYFIAYFIPCNNTLYFNMCTFNVLLVDETPFHVTITSCMQFISIMCCKPRTVMHYTSFLATIIVVELYFLAYFKPCYNTLYFNMCTFNVFLVDVTTCNYNILLADSTFCILYFNCMQL
jgi:hypothetical protein